MPPNLHAVALILDRYGVMIVGPSGTGKTELALGLMSHAAAWRLFARLVADDQVFPELHGRRLVVTAPPAIAGLAEARGFGPAPLPFARRAVVDLVVRLVEGEGAPRMAGEDAACDFDGVAIPELVLPAHDASAAIVAIAARLGMPPFHAPVDS